MGIRPEHGGLRIDPCIPADWSEFSVRRTFRGKVLDIQIDNAAGVQKGVSHVILNGERIEGNLITADRMQDENKVVAVME